MRVVAAHGQVQVRAERVAQRAEEMRYEFGRQLADALAREAARRRRSRRAPTGRAQRAPCVSSIGSVIVTAPRDMRPPAPPPQRRSGRCRACRRAPAQRLAERERAVLDRVVLVDVRVAGALQRQREAAVLADLFEHVVEEAEARCARWARRYVSRSTFDGDPRFLRVALDPGAMRGASQQFVCDARSSPFRGPRRKPRTPRFAANCTSVCAIADHRRLTRDSSRRRRGSGAPGRRRACACRWPSWPKAAIDQHLAKAMPCEAKMRSSSSCGPSKCRCGKLSVPRPSWFVTITSS